MASFCGIIMVVSFSFVKSSHQGIFKPMIHHIVHNVVFFQSTGCISRMSVGAVCLQRIIQNLNVMNVVKK